MKYNFKQALLVMLISVAPISSALSTPLPLDIQAGQLVASYYPTGPELVEGLEPFCKERKIEGDLCSLGYAATLTAEAMSKASYSAKDTLSAIVLGGYGSITAYEHARLEELISPLIGMFAINGGPEYMVKYGLSTKQDAIALVKLLDKKHQKEFLKSQGVN